MAAGGRGGGKGWGWERVIREGIRKGGVGGVWNWRQLVLSAAVGLWAGRCMFCLFCIFYSFFFFAFVDFLRRLR